MTLARTAKFSIGAILALIALSGLMTLVLWLLLPSLAGGASSNGNTGYIRRYAANFATFGGPPELVTTAPPLAGAQGGMIIYNKNFFAADDVNTLYVTISAVGDDHAGARLELACLVDGKPCNPGPNPVGDAPSGWLTALRHKDYNDNYLPAAPFFGDGGGGAGDLHDNVVAYQWCTPFETKAGTHNVQVKFASSPVPGEPASTGAPVFLEAVHFFVDGSRVADETNACTNKTIDPTVATSPSTTTAPDGSIIDTTTFAPLTGLTPLNNPVPGHNH